MNDKTILYQLTETSAFMMSFVIVTKSNNCIVIDGGRKEDIPLLKEYVAGRKRMKMYGTKMTRKWMDMLGVKKHYVTKDGTQTIEL